MESLRKGPPRPQSILRHSNRPKDFEFEMFKMPKSSSNSRGVVIAIEETVPAEFVRSTSSKAYDSTPKPVASMRSEVAHETSHYKTSNASNRLPAPLNLLISPARERSPRSNTSSPNLVSSNDIGSAVAHSPVMHSMFPRYDPTIPLAKQHYYPDHEINREPADPKPKLPWPSASSASFLSPSPPKVNTRSPSTLSNGKSGVPVHDSNSSELSPAISTPEELLDLWSVANGQGSQEAAETYTLRLSWYASIVWQNIQSFS